MEARKQYGFEPDYAVPPGETVLEVMQSLNMTQRDLAARTGLTVQTLHRIFKGQQPITHETANRLELVTSVPAKFWNNLESQYQEQKTRIEERKRLAGDVRWLKIIPTKELMERNCIKPVTDDVELLREVLGFYGVSGVDAWKEVWLEPAVAARRSPCFDSQPGPASAWIRQGELQAQKTVCRPFDKDAFKNALRAIRGLTRESPQVFEPEMRRLCAEAGVAVALVREMKKAPWNGATEWLSPDKVMILLSLRGKGEDTFWFSFFHEAGHVLFDNKKDLLINNESTDDPREARANDFAANFLIPSEYDHKIRCFRSRMEVLQLADELGIAPGIVAGRFQYLTGKWHFFNDLIRKLNWTEGGNGGECPGAAGSPGNVGGSGNPFPGCEAQQVLKTGRDEGGR